MAHALWKGSIAFGLVNIPVNMYAAEKKQELDFRMLDKKDMSPVGYKKVNKTTGEEVPRERLVKGYEYQDERYVLVGEEDFKRAGAEKTQRIDIQSFADASEIDPAYFERPYYLEPAAKADKAYALLREAMRRAGKAGIATVVISSREHLAALLPRGDLLLLDLLRFQHELRGLSELRLPAADVKKLKISEAELKMAQRLIADLEAPFDASRYKDEYHDELLAFIRKKAQAGGLKEVTLPPEKKARLEPPADIMKLLKESVGKTGKGKPPHGKGLMH